jgi:hypothetical protein
MSSKFQSTFNRGFKITFENGWTISVQFGPGYYCEHRDDSACRPEGVYSSKDAEIAIITDNYRIWLDLTTLSPSTDDSTDIKGYVTPDELPRYILLTSMLPPANATDSNARGN